MAGSRRARDGRHAALCRSWADGPPPYPRNHETLGVVVPWGPRHFQYTSKHNTLAVEGVLRLGGASASGSTGVAAAREIRFEGPDAFACLDFGRGVWPYRCTWNWGAGSGRQGQHLVGLNLGGQWTDGTGVTENAVCIDGRLVYIGEDLVWDYDPSAWMKPWRVRTSDGALLDLEFTPMLERTARSNALVIRSEVHQMFGHWRGRIPRPDGGSLEIDGLLGWAEDHRARW
jgi:hypothetical protein